MTPRALAHRWLFSPFGVAVLFILAHLIGGCTSPAGAIRLAEPTEAPVVDAAPATPGPIHVATAPELRAPVTAAITEWADITGLQFLVTSDAPSSDGVLSWDTWQFAFGEVENATVLAQTKRAPWARAAYVTTNAEMAQRLSFDQLRVAFLHEIGHALGLVMSESDDRDHYFGAEPSVMTTHLVDSAEHLGMPEIRAWQHSKGESVEKQKKELESTSKLRAANAKLAAVVGVNTSQAKGELSDARQLVDELLLSVGRAS